MRAFWIAAVVIVIAGFALVVGIAQLTDKGAANRQTDQSVNAVLNNLDQVRGKRIAVQGDVKVRMAPWAVTVGSSDATQTGLLIVSSDRLPRKIHQATRIVATGIAKPFSLAAFRRAHPEFSGGQVKKSALVDLVGKPAVVNARVTISPPSS
ncbi:MAG: hypothetical protein ACTHKS_07220, partial [Gaiellaceae bacterium]